MNVYGFPSAGYARRFRRNARSRGYAVKLDGRLVTVDRVDAQMRLLVQRYVGMRVNDAKTTD